MNFDHVYPPSPNSSWIHCFSLPISFAYFFPIKVNLCCPNILGYVASHSNMELIRGYTLKEN